MLYFQQHQERIYNSNIVMFVPLHKPQYFVQRCFVKPRLQSGCTMLHHVLVSLQISSSASSNDSSSVKKKYQKTNYGINIMYEFDEKKSSVIDIQQRELT